MRGLLAPRRVPVLLQTTSTECGAVCLAMVLAYHGRRTEVAELRDHFGIGRDGAKARTLVGVARAYGLQARAFSVDVPRFGELRLPAIVHWEFNHFVVVERFGARGVDIVDPAVGRRRLTPEEFRKGFTGIALTFEPGLHFERRGGTRASGREGGWGDGPGGPAAPFHTALAVGTLLLDARHRSGPEAREGLAWLLRHQQPDGGWAHVPIMRMPRPDVHAPWEDPEGCLLIPVLTDRNRLFTTATVLHALVAWRDAGRAG